MKTGIYFVAALLLTGGCAIEDPEPRDVPATPGAPSDVGGGDRYGVRVATRLLAFEAEEVGPEEIAAIFADAELPAPAQLPLAATDLINTFAETAVALFRSDESSYRAVVCGHALPPGATPWQLQYARMITYTYEKHAESWLGFDLARFKYKLRFLTEGAIDDRGSYLANVSFVPISAALDPTVSLTVTGTSSAPINVGTEMAPVAMLQLDLGFSLNGIGSKFVSDAFTLYGNTHEIHATVGDFE
jgi:hypothetical protein